METASASDSLPHPTRARAHVVSCGHGDGRCCQSLALVVTVLVFSVDFIRSRDYSLWLWSRFFQ